MIFSASKGMYTDVLLVEKTLTTRIKLPAHIAVGKTWAIVPKRASPAWWFGDLGNGWQIFTTGTKMMVSAMLNTPTESFTVASGSAYLRNRGFVQARIRIDSLYQNALGDMSEQDARDDGAASVYEYGKLWTAINPKLEWSFHMSLQIWRIRFSLPQEVCIAVSKVGRDAILAAAAGLTPAEHAHALKIAAEEGLS